MLSTAYNNKSLGLPLIPPEET